MDHWMPAFNVGALGDLVIWGASDEGDLGDLGDLDDISDLGDLGEMDRQVGT